MVKVEPQGKVASYQMPHERQNLGLRLFLGRYLHLGLQRVATHFGASRCQTFSGVVRVLETIAPMIVYLSMSKDPYGGNLEVEIDRSHDISLHSIEQLIRTIDGC